MNWKLLRVNGRFELTNEGSSYRESSVIRGMLYFIYRMIKARSNGHDSWWSRTFEHELSFTIINYHQLSCSSNMFKFDMIVRDSFFRLTEQMIVYDSFSVSGGNQGGLNAICLPHCHRPVKNNKAIIWTNIRTTVTLKARKWEKRKNLKNQATRSGVVVWYAPIK